LESRKIKEERKEKMITTIEHPKLACPNCGSKKIKIYRTKSIRSVDNKRILRVERFLKCKNCEEMKREEKTFKTVEVL
jgi:DNA-directed RNA polymerase subunit M/transcription elongation factor TFIIS